MGDVVEIGGGEQHIIYETMLVKNNKYEYSTNLGAWYSHKECKLVKECCKESMEELINDLIDEGELEL